jgi:hypothetical protein
MKNNKNEENVRSPDPIIKETLIPNFQTDLNVVPDPDSELLLNKIIKMSMDEFELYNKNEDQKLEQIINEETEERLNKYENIKKKVKHLSVIDKKLEPIYVNLLSIIEMYEQGYIINYELKKEEHKQIFNILRTIRLTKKELDTLHDLLVYTD